MIHPDRIIRRGSIDIPPRKQALFCNVIGVVAKYGYPFPGRLSSCDTCYKIVDLFNAMALQGAEVMPQHPFGERIEVDVSIDKTRDYGLSRTIDHLSIRRCCSRIERDNGSIPYDHAVSSRKFIFQGDYIRVFKDFVTGHVSSKAVPSLRH